MIVRRNPDAETAVQYLVWALEEIVKTDNQEAARHARNAIDALREGQGDQIDEHMTPRQQAP